MDGFGLRILELKVAIQRCLRPAFGSGAFATGLAAVSRLDSAGLRSFGLNVTPGA